MWGFGEKSDFIRLKGGGGEEGEGGRGGKEGSKKLICRWELI